MKKQKLELTWIGKENRPKLEPRILLEDPAKSYHVRYQRLFVMENDMVVTAKFWTILCVGATKSPGAILNASPEGVRHMDMPNNSFAHWWQHGYTTERDFLYITTASLTHEQLQQLGDEVGSEHSLQVENLPTAPHPSPLPEGEGIIKMALPQAGEGIEINGRMDVENKSKPRVKKTDGMGDLFGGDA